MPASSGPSATGSGLSVVNRPQRLKTLAAPVIFLAAALALVASITVAGDVLLPTPYLGGFAPQSAHGPARPDEGAPQWNPLQWDSLAQFYPWRLLIRRTVQAGQIPLWNSHTLCGSPLLANSQSAPFYPLHLLYYLPGPLAVATIMALLAVLHLTIAGWGAYALAVSLRLRWGGAICAGLLFELNTSHLAWLELPSALSVTCWIPVSLFLLRRLIDVPHPRGVAYLSLSVGAMILGGHLQFALYGLMALALCLLLGLRRAIAGGAAAAVCGSLVIGLALAAVQLMPAQELVSLSHRAGSATGAGWTAYAAYALPIANWVTLAAPDFYGLPSASTFWGYWNYGATNVQEYSGGIGFPGLCLAAVALGGTIRRRKALHLALALLVLALTLASATPLLRALYFGLPGFSSSGSPARVLILLSLSLSLVAGAGVDNLVALARRNWIRPGRVLLCAMLAASALLAGLAGVALLSLPIPQSTDVELALRQVSLPALTRALVSGAAMLMSVLLIGWLFRENAPRLRRNAIGTVTVVACTGWLVWGGQALIIAGPAELLYPESELTRYLVASPDRTAVINRSWRLVEHPEALLPPNAAIAYGFRDAQGYDSLQPRHYRRLLDAIAAPASQSAAPPENGNISFVKNPLSPLFPLLAAPLIVSTRPLPEAPALRPVARLDEVLIYNHRDVLAEAEIYGAWRPASDSEAIGYLQKSDPANGRAREAVTAGGESSARSTPAGPAAPQTLTRLSSTRLRVSLAAGQSGLLVVRETFMPGWQAYLATASGITRQPVQRTEIAFQGVEITGEELAVELRYEPTSFRAGLFVTLAALCLALALALQRPDSTG